VTQDVPKSGLLFGFDRKYVLHQLLPRRFRQEYQVLAAILRTGRFIASHPLTRDHKLAAFARLARWQVESRMRAEVVVPWIAGTRLAVSRGMHGATGNIYCGLHEFAEMAFVLHLLRAGDLFADIGANVGSYTVLAGGVRGARVVAVEPDARAGPALARNIALNRLGDRVSVHSVAVGATVGELAFSIGQDTTNHVLSASDGAHHQVQQTTVDLLFADEAPLAMKLDVEGYEAAVLAAAGATLGDPALKALIVELNGSGSRYGFDDQQTDHSLLECGFAACNYHPVSRLLAAQEGFSGQNTIYVRDFDWIQNRLKTAPSFKVFNREVA
jgi:FkbM family methyltransferase